MPRDITLELDGKPVTLRYTMNELLILEEKFDVPFDEALEQLFAMKSKLRSFRYLLWLGLQSSTPGLTEEQAGAMIPSADVWGLISQIMRAVGMAMPEDEPKNAGDAGGDAV